MTFNKAGSICVFILVRLSLPLKNCLGIWAEQIYRQANTSSPSMLAEEKHQLHPARPPSKASQGHKSAAAGSPQTSPEILSTHQTPEAGQRSPWCPCKSAFKITPLGLDGPSYVLKTLIPNWEFPKTFLRSAAPSEAIEMPFATLRKVRKGMFKVYIFLATSIAPDFSA